MDHDRYMMASALTQAVPTLWLECDDTGATP